MPISHGKKIMKWIVSSSQGWKSGIMVYVNDINITYVQAWTCSQLSKFLTRRSKGHHESYLLRLDKEQLEVQKDGRIAHLPSPFIPEAPLDRHCARSFSIGVLALLRAFLDFCISSLLPLSVQAIMLTLYHKRISTKLIINLAIDIPRWGRGRWRRRYNINV